MAGALDSGTSLGTQVTLSPEDLYAYCFETPAGSLVSITQGKSSYDNIYSIVNPADPVPKVAPGIMGFSRYGKDKYLPSIEQTANYDAQCSIMLQKYHDLISTSFYDVDDFEMKKFGLIPYLGVHDDINNHETQRAFLDNFIMHLVKDNIKTRSNYVNTYQDDFREVSGAAFGTSNQQWETFKTTFQKNLSENTQALILSSMNISINGDKLPDLIEKIAIQSLNEANITSYDQQQVNKLATTLASLFTSFTITHPSMVATVLGNLQGIGGAHYPELCLAWMQSMDSNYTLNAGTSFSNGAYRIIHINCPVDVSVYDKAGTLVAQITSDQPVKVDGSSVVSAINEDGEKIVYLPTDCAYTVKMTATDNGSVDYSVDEYSAEAGDIARFDNYYDVPVQKGDTLTGIVLELSSSDKDSGLSDGSTTNYKLLNANGEVLTPNVAKSGSDAANAYYMVTVTSENNDYGTVTGQGTRQLGNYALVSAQPKDGYKFDGWYVNDSCVSTDADYRFRVTQDVSLVAKFSTNSTPATQYTLQAGKVDHGSLQLSETCAPENSTILVTAVPEKWSDTIKMQRANTPNVIKLKRNRMVCDEKIR